MTARTRKLCMEKMEERQLMAADFGASAGKATLVNAAPAGSAQTVQVAQQFSAQASLAPITSTAVGGKAGGTTANLNAAASNNGIILVPLAPTTPTVQLKNGDIHIEGTNGNDVVNVSFVNNQYNVKVNNTIYRFLKTSTSGGDVFFNGYDGNDTFRNEATSGLRATAKGMNGNDTLVGGAKNDVLDGGYGVDDIYGMGGNDEIRAGYDTSWNYVEGGAGNDEIHGGMGLDYLNGNDGDDWIDGGLGEDYIEGGNGNDKLFGGYDYSYNYLAGGNGNDEIWGGYGFDYMLGNAGNDVLRGDYGNDFLHGGTGFDKLFGGDGDDELDGGLDQTSDEIWGGAGRDKFHDEQFFVTFGWDNERHENIRDFENGIDMKV